jgi:hypothetical protein
MVFKANLTLNNVNLTSSFTETGGVRVEVLSLPSKDKLAIENTTAISLHVPLSYVKVSGVKAVDEDTSVSSFSYFPDQKEVTAPASSSDSVTSEFQSSFRSNSPPSPTFSPFYVSSFFSRSFSLKKPLLLSSSRKRIVILLTISSPVTTATNTTSLYYQLKSSFVASVSGGNFTRTLQRVSSSLGSSTFLHCNASAVTVSSPVIVPISSSSTSLSDDDSGFVFSIPVIIGISLAGSVLSLLIMGFCYYYYVKTPSSSSFLCCGPGSLYSRTETKEINRRRAASSEKKRTEVRKARKGPPVGGKYDYVLRNEEKALTSRTADLPSSLISPTAPTAASPFSQYQVMTSNAHSTVEVIEIELGSLGDNDQLPQPARPTASSLRIQTNQNSGDYSLRKVSDSRKAASSSPPTTRSKGKHLQQQLQQQQPSGSRFSSPPPSPLNRSESFKDRYSPKAKQQQHAKLKTIKEKELDERTGHAWKEESRIWNEEERVHSKVVPPSPLEKSRQSVARLNTDQILL